MPDPVTTPWGKGSTFRVVRGVLRVAGVSAEVSAMAEERRADLEDGKLVPVVRIIGDEATIELRGVAVQTVRPRPARRIPPPPGVVGKARGFAGALWKHARARFASVTPEEYRQRRAACDGCWAEHQPDAKDRRGCWMCGCTERKLQWAEQKCPRGLW